MNRSELDAKVAARMGAAKSTAHDAVEEVLGAINEAVAAGEEVRLVGFGSFSVRVKAPTAKRRGCSTTRSRSASRVAGRSMGVGG